MSSTPWGTDAAGTGESGPRPPVSGGSAAQGNPILTPLTPRDPREIGGYLLRARIGEGGMGAVYLSYTPGGRPVAVKIARPEFAADPEFRRRFATEVALVQRVQGLYTAPVIDCDAQATLPWLATAYVAAPSLAAVVARQGPLPPETVLVLIAGIAEALAAIHGAGVIHRDLKPGNVIVAADGPRVIDFGISRAVEASSGAITRAGARIGTPAFMAPEQVQGGSFGAAGDVFALGSTAYYAATGEMPFGADAAVFHRIEHHQPDWDRIPDRVRTVLHHCLAKEPAVRPTPAALIELCRLESTDERLRIGEGWLPPTVAAEITRYSLTPPPPVPPPSPAPGGRMGIPSGRLIGAVAAILMVGALAAVLAVVLAGNGDGSGRDAGTVTPQTTVSAADGRAIAAASAGPTRSPSPSPSPPSSSPTSAPSPTRAFEPRILYSGRVTLSDSSDDAEFFDADSPNTPNPAFVGGDFTIDLSGTFTGEKGSLAPTSAVDYPTCHKATGFGLALRPADLRAGMLLCGNTSEGRTVGITVDGFHGNERGRVTSVTFSYTTWARPDES
ncbi:serine/threonine-protein kinase [Frankia sp. QA3]|uniref:serine/threonine-protein kinase n=1 Tax=Frankia sp. QA3 TaxID=710111 RepID=UPI000269C0BC|nr:serine/threonine-protein kinase [Frankia sp. QA3]EIV91595.1 protein kinase family protein [Frankia sp. QA3]